MKHRNPTALRNRTCRGFTLIEVLVSITIFLVIGASVFGLVNMAQRINLSEENTLDIFQNAREGVDQMVREIRWAGYPRPGLFDVATGFTPTNTNRVAATFLTVANTNLVFEADLDNDGIVERVQYQLAGTTLNRSGVSKNANGTVPPAAFFPFIDNIANTAAQPIFSNYATAPPNQCGIAPSSTLPAPQDTRQICLQLVLQSPQVDPLTRQFRQVTLMDVVQRLNPD